MKRRCIMPTFGYLPYQRWALLNLHHYLSLRNTTTTFFHIKLPQKTKVLAMPVESTCDGERKYLR